MASWLDSVFASFDGKIFSFMNSFAKSAGGFFTPFFKLVSLFGEAGIFFIILSLVLLLFKNSRRLGVTMLIAMAIGAIFTNLIIKNVVARQRPFTRDEYKEFWLFVSGKKQSEYSFPSGHVTVTMTTMTAMLLTCNKKWSFLGMFAVLLMAFSRVYLIIHYTTDVIGGIIIGGITGTIAFFLAKLIYSKIEKHQDKKFCSFVLNADLAQAIKKRKDQKKHDEQNADGQEK